MLLVPTSKQASIHHASAIDHSHSSTAYGQSQLSVYGGGAPALETRPHGLFTRPIRQFLLPLLNLPLLLVLHPLIQVVSPPASAIR